jgi:hypothetical protein
LELNETHSDNASHVFFSFPTLPLYDLNCAISWPLRSFFGNALYMPSVTVDVFGQAGHTGQAAFDEPDELDDELDSGHFWPFLTRSTISSTMNTTTRTSNKTVDFMSVYTKRETKKIAASLAKRYMLIQK